MTEYGRSSQLGRELRVADLDPGQVSDDGGGPRPNKVRAATRWISTRPSPEKMDRYLRKRQNVTAGAALSSTDGRAFFKSTESLGKVFARIAQHSASD